METIAFEDVKVGDRVFQHNLFAPDKWRRVTEIAGPSKNGTITLYIGHAAHPAIDTRIQICGHAQQGIAVKRS